MHIRTFPAEKKQKEEYFTLMEEFAKEHIEKMLSILGLSRESFRELFFTLGEVHGVMAKEEDIGFCWVEIRKDILHLHAIVIRENQRRKGHGTRILAHIEDAYRDLADTIELGVHEENTAALGLYERCGFQQKAYRHDVGYHIMQKSIKHHPDKKGGC